MTSTNAEGGVEGKALFAQVQFHIVHTDDLRSANAAAARVHPSQMIRSILIHTKQLAKLLQENGAQELSPPEGEGIPMEEVTHIISTTIDFPDYDAANDALKSVVKPDWVHASITKGRLANPRQHSPDPRLFFSGLVVCCADLPSGDSDAIIGGVLAMGGLYSSAVSKMVTHLVALTIDSEKCQTVLAKNLKCRIVLPHW